MNKYKIRATKFTFMDAIVEAKDEDEARAMYNSDNVEWVEVGTDIDDWEFYDEQVYEVEDMK